MADQMSTQRQLSGDYYSQFTSTIQIPNLAKEIKSVFQAQPTSKRQPERKTLPNIAVGLGRRQNQENPHKCDPERSILTGLLPFLGLLNKKESLAHDQNKFHRSGIYSFNIASRLKVTPSKQP